MRNKPRPERQCRRKISRTFRRMMRNDPDGFRAAVDSFVEIIEEVTRRHSPTGDKP